MSKINIDIELLISCVENRPCLWDRYCNDYKDKVKTNAAWKEVCCLLKKDFDTLPVHEKETFGRGVIKKWNGIRDSVRRYLKQVREKAPGSSTKQYLYYEDARFLKKVLHGGHNGGTSPPLLERDEVDDHTDTASSISAASTPTPRISFRKRRKVDELNETMPRALKGSENPHLSFCKGILPAINDFNEEETIDFQIGVLQIIRNIRNKRSNPSTLSSDILAVL